MAAGTNRGRVVIPTAPQWETDEQTNLWGQYVLPLLGLFLLARPLMSFLVQSSVAIAAAILDRVDGLDAFLFQSDLVPLDRVYVSIFLRVVGNIHAQGLAVAGEMGESLHSLLPEVFEAPTLVAEGAWVSALLVSSSSVLAVFLCRLTGCSLLFLLGSAVAQSAMGGRQRWFLSHRTPKQRLLFLIGVILQAEALVGMATVVTTTSDTDLDTMGFALMATKILGQTPTEYEAQVGLFARSLLCILLALGIGLVLLLTSHPWKRGPLPAAGATRGVDDPDWIGAVGHSVVAVGPRFQSVALLVVAVSVAISPARHIAPGKFTQVSEVLAEEPNGALAAYSRSQNGATLGSASTASDDSEVYGQNDAVMAASRAPIARQVGSLVSVSGHNYRYTLYVNGAHQILRGVGYNPMYRNLPERERSERYDRDFRSISASGFNAILGWSQEEFDALTLQKAHEYGLGVLLPYDLPPLGNYTDSAVTERLKRDIAAWVQKHKDAPALRMWAIGNEVFHDMKDRSQAPAFARFYAELTSMVHELDPAHPVLYREAEDAYLPMLRNAFRDVGARRYWMVYGMNIFTYRMSTVLAKWPEQGIDMPMLVSEFGPTGLNRQARPGGYVKMWRTMMKEPGLVLGGFAYTWTTAGPEALDRSFGLVDEKGEPVDGALAALTAQHWWETEMNSRLGEP